MPRNIKNFVLGSLVCEFELAPKGSPDFVENQPLKRAKDETVVEKAVDKLCRMKPSTGTRKFLIRRLLLYWPY